MASVAMFEGLVVDEAGQVAEVAWVGGDACYLVDDDGFRLHIDAAAVDRQVLQFIKEQVQANRDLAVRGILQMMGKDDVFSKTAVEYSINRMEEATGQRLPPEAQEMLRSLGFRIVINVHGEVVTVDLPVDESDDE